MLGGHVDAQAPLAVEADALVDGAPQRVHRPAPVGRPVPLLRAPAVGAHLEARVRHQIHPALRRDDVTRPHGIGTRLLERDVVHPQRARRGEPDLETALRADGALGPEQEVELLPLGAWGEGVAQAAVGPLGGVGECDRDDLALDPLAPRPQPHAVGLPAGDRHAHLREHRVARRVPVLKPRARQPRAPLPVAALIECQGLRHELRVAGPPPLVGRAIAVGIGLEARVAHRARPADGNRAAGENEQHHQHTLHRSALQGGATDYRPRPAGGQASASPPSPRLRPGFVGYRSQPPHRFHCEGRQ